MPAGEYTGEHARLLAVAKMEDATGQAEEVRQLPDLFASASLEVSVFPKVNGQSVPERGRTVGITCVETVSYTHLDVYKRQRLARAPKNCISLPVWVAETQQQME